MKPILFEYGWFRVHSYGLMLMVGFALGVAWSAREAKRRGLSPTLITDYALWALLSAIVFSRVLFVLLNLKLFLQYPAQIWQLWKGGLSFHGGLGGAILALYFFCKKRGVGFLQLMDLIAPSVPLGYAFARIGCFLNGCCYGVPTDLPWGVVFHNEHIPGAFTPPSHPVQLYDSAISLLLFGLLAWRRGYVRFDGQMALWYFGSYSIIRFAMEGLRRGATGQIIALGLTEAQIGSLLIIALTTGALIAGGRRADARAERNRATPSNEAP